MNFKQFQSIMSDKDGFVPTPRFRQVIQTNTRSTAREEAIAAKIIESANPRENVTGHYGWGAEQQIVLQQLWIHPKREEIEWRDIPVKGDQQLYSVVSTEHGPLPVPEAVKEPETIRADFHERLREILGQQDTDVLEEQ